MAARSDAMDGRVQAIEARALGNENLLNAVDGRVVSLTARHAEVDQRLVFVDERAAATDARLMDAQQQIGEARAGLAASDQRHADTDVRVKELEAGLEAASTRDLALNGRVDGVDKRVYAIDTRIGDVEGRMTAFGERVLVAAERASSAAERVAGYDTRVGAVEATVNGFDGRLRVLEPLKVTLDGQEFQAVQDEKRLYEEAVALLRANAFDKAVQAFDLLLRRYPGSGFIHAARYGLGSAHFGDRAHKDAIEFFRQFVADAPEHPRAPDALLAMSTSQLELKDRAGARRTIEGLIRSYPSSDAALVGRQRLPSLR
jgi:tol-pal system protein YbgF